MNYKIFGNDGKVLFGDNKYEIINQFGNNVIVKTKSGLYQCKINSCNGNNIRLFDEDIIVLEGGVVPPPSPVFPPKGTYTRNVGNGERFGDVTIQGNEYIWVGLPTSTGPSVQAFVINDSDTSQAMEITGTYLNRLQSIEYDDYTWYKCSPSMFYDDNITFNGILFSGILDDVLVMFDESTGTPYVGTYDDAWKLADTDVFRFTQYNSQPLCGNGNFASVTKDMKFVIGISLAAIENNQYPQIMLKDFMTNTVIAHIPDSEEAEKDFVHWDYNGVRYYEIVPEVELPNGGIIGTVFGVTQNCGVYCWRDNTTDKAYIKGIENKLPPPTPKPTPNPLPATTFKKLYDGSGLWGSLEEHDIFVGVSNGTMNLHFYQYTPKGEEGGDFGDITEENKGDVVYSDGEIDFYRFHWRNIDPAYDNGIGIDNNGSADNIYLLYKNDEYGEQIYEEWD